MPGVTRGTTAAATAGCAWCLLFLGLEATPGAHAVVCGDGTETGIPAFSYDQCNACPGTAEGCESAECALMPDGNCKYTLTNDRRSASTHWSFGQPSGATRPSWFINSIIPRRMAAHTYWNVVGNAYGYGGLQQVLGGHGEMSVTDWSRERIVAHERECAETNVGTYYTPVNASHGHYEGCNGAPERGDHFGSMIFSVWDQGCDRDVTPDCDPDEIAKTLVCGTGVYCSDLGGEGTGRKSMLKSSVDWPFPVAGDEYYLAIQAEPVDDGARMVYTGYCWAEIFGGWKLLSKIEVGTGGKDWSIHDLYAFLEQYTGAEGLSARSGAYGPAWMAGNDPDGKDAAWADFEQITSASFTHGYTENYAHVNSRADPDSDGLILEMGEEITHTAAYGSSFDFAKASELPKPIAELSTKRACLLAATTLDSINSCLENEQKPTPVPPAPSASPPPPRDPACDDEGTSVSCGGHWATCCAMCPYNGNANMGAGWCNGECEWDAKASACVPPQKTKKNKKKKKNKKSKANNENKKAVAGAKKKLSKKAVKKICKAAKNKKQCKNAKAPCAFSKKKGCAPKK